MLAALIIFTIVFSPFVILYFEEKENEKVYHETFKMRMNKKIK